MQNNSPKHINKTAIKAIILHTFGVQVVLLRYNPCKALAAPSFRFVGNLVLHSCERCPKHATATPKT